MNLSRFAATVAQVAICLALLGCGSVHYKHTSYLEPAKKHGPPPHAPAHGYHHKHGDVALEYDSTLKVYLVGGHSNYYFHDKSYYRATSSGWEITAQFEGPWKTISTKKLPKGLSNSAHAKNGKKKNNKKRGD